MAQFRGTVTGSRSVTSRLGTKNSGLRTEAAGWQGKIVVYLTEAAGQDHYEVYLEPHMGSGGRSRRIAHGRLNASIPGGEV